MAKSDNKRTFANIMAELKAGKYAPIYFLMGEEPYFIDKIADYIEHNALPKEAQDMNLRVMYGKDISISDVINNEARQYPFMTDRRVVIIKEAQNLKKQIDMIESYLNNPMLSTILVFCYKYEKLDGRKKYAKKIDELGVLFSSNRLYDNKIPEWIKSFCMDLGLNINITTATMLAAHIGNDLLRIESEIKKLQIVMGDTSKVISSELVANNVGFSKEFNNFELTAALSDKNSVQTYRIIEYFSRSPKSFVIQQTLAVLYNHFEKLLYYHLLENKSQQTVAQALGIHPFFVKDYVEAATHYPISKLRYIIGEIRQTDAKSKGFDSVNNSPEDLLKELCFKILN